MDYQNRQVSHPEVGFWCSSGAISWPSPSQIFGIKESQASHQVLQTWWSVVAGGMVSTGQVACWLYYLGNIMCDTILKDCHYNCHFNLLNMIVFFFLGLIQTIKFNYTEAHTHLEQAIEEHHRLKLPLASGKLVTSCFSLLKAVCCCWSVNGWYSQPCLV